MDRTPPVSYTHLGWTKIRSGGLEGWLKNDYLVFGQDIKPLAKELGLFTARVTTQTLHVRETPSTDAAIIGLAAADDYYPVLEAVSYTHLDVYKRQASLCSHRRPPDRSNSRPIH